ncbi:MAG: chromosomal replication initiator protein DnaA [Candidatus Promineifilaceae bacterium]
MEERMNAESAWRTALGDLELQMTKATFNTWLKDARVLASDEDEYVVGVRNDYAKDWLEKRLRALIERTLAQATGRPTRVRFVVWADEIIQPAAELANGDDGSAANGRDPALGANANLNGRYTFSTFVVGQSNRLAHAAALSVADQPGMTYNPLFIYGGVGLGKTHLLGAIGHRCLEKGLRVCYISSETFTNDLIQSIRSQKMTQFRERYRTLDVLLIDDIQFIAGKESTQDEFFHTFNELHSRGRQVVLSSDRPPKAMVTLEERLQSRFEWGLMADIQLPDVETRIAILRAKAESSGVHVPAAVIDTIAHHVRKNIRELEGALNKVIAYAQLSDVQIDEQLAALALAEVIRQPEKITLSVLLDTVCDYYHVTLEALRSNSRSRAVAFPRQVAMYLARTETEMSYPQIGERLGHRDHTTILYGYEKITELLETDSAVRRDVMEIKAQLYDPTAA